MVSAASKRTADIFKCAIIEISLCIVI
jgi:hypothetical protein